MSFTSILYYRRGHESEWRREIERVRKTTSLANDRRERGEYKNRDKKLGEERNRRILRGPDII